MAKLSGEIFEDLKGHLSEIIGDKAVNLLLNKLEERDNLHLVVFKISEEIEKIYGKRGAYSVLRELGRSVARDLMEKHPREEWEDIFKKGLNLMGFAEGVEMRPDRACICSCAFYPKFLTKEGLKPTQHPVCWIGWGFVEGFMKALTGAKGVKFAQRDFDKKQCWFEIVNF